MRRTPLLPLVLLALASTACDVELFPEPRVTVTPDIGNLALGGYVTLQVHVEGEAHGPIQARSLNPAIVVDSVTQAPGASEATVVLHAVDETRALVELGDEETVISRKFEIRQPRALQFVAYRGTQPDRVALVPSVFKVDARSTLDLQAWLLRDGFFDGYSGRGVVATAPSAGFAVTVDPAQPNVDVLRVGPTAPGRYEIPLTMGGVAAEPVTYVAVSESEAAELSLVGPGDDEGPAPGSRICTVAEVRDAEGAEIFAPRAVWTIDGVEQAVHGDHLCYDVRPDGPTHNLVVTYGGTRADLLVYGDNLEAREVGIR